LASQRRILAILNPAAGGGRASRRFERVLPRLRQLGKVEVATTTAPGHAEELARAADASVVVAAGGDGTVHEVVNGLLAVPASRALAVAPLGTGCDFARNLGMRGREGRWNGRERRIDVGHAKFTDGTTRYFVNAANLGASTASPRRVNSSALLRRAGAAAYVIAGLPEVVRRPTQTYEVQHDGEVARATELLNLSICNGPRFGGGLCLVPEARLDDGALHVAAIGALGVGALLNALRVGYSAGTAPRPGVETRAVGEIRVVGEGNVELDGEIPGELPATFRITRRAISVLV
jgi:YegS/Rv2252/BmrU family lipid kinase